MPEIIPEKFYAPREIVRMNILPWHSAMTFNKKLLEQRWLDIFNPIVEDVKGRRMIHIKGDRIIKYLELVANGQLS